jgi:hypothetical protein
MCFVWLSIVFSLNLLNFFSGISNSQKVRVREGFGISLSYKNSTLMIVTILPANLVFDKLWPAAGHIVTSNIFIFSDNSFWTYFSNNLINHTLNNSNCTKHTENSYNYIISSILYLLSILTCEWTKMKHLNNVTMTWIANGWLDSCLLLVDIFQGKFRSLIIFFQAFC